MNEDPEGRDAAASAAPPAAEPHRRGPLLGGIALLVAIAALVVAAWGIWRVQLLAKGQQAAHEQDQQTIAALQKQLAAGSQQAVAGTRRVAALESQLGTLQSSDRGLDQRIANLETSVATLSGQQQSGHDAALLDDAQMLLRMGQQRYELSHDVSGALKAYGQAIDVLGQVENPAYAAVRDSAITERDALASAAPAVPRQAALDLLTALRGKVASLPLASAAPATASSASRPGFWSRVGHAFSGIITVQREGQAALPSGTPLGRQGLALDLAQAQEALLDFDRTAYRTALQQAARALAEEFDGRAPEVQAASADIAKLLAQGPTGAAPKLGGALAQLQSVRASLAAAPASAATVAPSSAPASGSTDP